MTVRSVPPPTSRMVLSVLMIFKSVRPRWKRFTILVMLGWLVFGSIVTAQNPAARGQSDQAAAQSTLAKSDSKGTYRLDQVRIGFAGRYKVGHWVPLWFDLKSDGGTGTATPFEGVVEVEAPDADAVPVIFRTPVAYTGEPFVTVETLFRLGRTTGQVVVRLRPYASTTSASHDSAQNTDAAERPLGPAVWSVTLPLRETDEPAPSTTLPAGGGTPRFDLPRPLPATAELLVNLGGELLTNESPRQRSRNASVEPVNVSVVLPAAGPFPTHPAAWESVEATLIATTGENPFTSLTGPSRQAFLRQLELGGRVLVCLGKNAQAVLADAELAAVFSPGRLDGVTKLPRAARLRTFAGVEEDLPLDQTPADYAIFEAVTWPVLSQEGEAIGQAGTIFQRRHGFGQITVTAVDFDQPPFLEWRGRTVSLRRALQPHLSRSANATDPMGNSINDADLAVQLRAALTQFSGVRVLGFLTLTMLLVGYVLLIGPADWWFLKRFVGRMRWTWLTAPILIVSVVIGAILLTGWTKGSSKINQAELIEIASVGQDRPLLVRGLAWTEFYTPIGRKATVTVTLPAGGFPRTDAAPAASTSANASTSTDGNFAPADTSRESLLVSWHGSPGSGLGGMSAPQPLFQQAEPYRVVEPNRSVGAEHRDDRTGPNEGSITAALVGVPMLPASSKGMMARWSFDANATIDSDFVREQAGRFHGSFVNPLPVSLKDVLVIHGDWAHLEAGPFAPGERITIERGRYPQTLEWRLRRKQSTATQDSLEPWDPDSRDTARILEVMMLHEASGGRSYTANATQKMFDRLDLSGALDDQTVMVIARLERPISQWTVDAPAPEPDRQESFVRMLLPIKPTPP